MNIDFDAPGQGQPAYKAGSGQQERPTGALADTTFTVSWTTPAAPLRGGNLIVTQPDGNGDANLTVTFNGKTLGGMRSITQQFGTSLKPSTLYTATVKVAGPTQGLLVKLAEQLEK